MKKYIKKRIEKIYKRKYKNIIYKRKVY